MSRVPATASEKRLVSAAVARLRSGILAVVGGLLCGSGLAFVTAWLTLLGGDPVGPHLQRLAIFFPGYSVTWPGVVIGFAYGLITGALVGAATGSIYNQLVDWRDRRR